MQKLTELLAIATGSADRTSLDWRKRAYIATQAAHREYFRLFNPKIVAKAPVTRLLYQGSPIIRALPNPSKGTLDLVVVDVASGAKRVNYVSIKSLSADVTVALTLANHDPKKQFDFLFNLPLPASATPDDVPPILLNPTLLIGADKAIYYSLKVDRAVLNENLVLLPWPSSLYGLVDRPSKSDDTDAEVIKELTEFYEANVVDVLNGTLYAKEAFINLLAAFEGYIVTPADGTMPKTGGHAPSVASARKELLEGQLGITASNDRTEVLKAYLASLTPLSAPTEDAGKGKLPPTDPTLPRRGFFESIPGPTKGGGAALTPATPAEEQKKEAEKLELARKAEEDNAKRNREALAKAAQDRAEREKATAEQKQKEEEAKKRKEETEKTKKEEEAKKREEVRKEEEAKKRKEETERAKKEEDAKKKQSDEEAKKKREDEEGKKRLEAQDMQDALEDCQENAKTLDAQIKLLESAREQSDDRATREAERSTSLEKALTDTNAKLSASDAGLAACRLNAEIIQTQLKEVSEARKKIELAMMSLETKLASANAELLAKSSAGSDPAATAAIERLRGERDDLQKAKNAAEREMQKVQEQSKEFRTDILNIIELRFDATNDEITARLRDLVERASSMFKTEPKPPSFLPPPPISKSLPTTTLDGKVSDNDFFSNDGTGAGGNHWKLYAPSTHIEVPARDRVTITFTGNALNPTTIIMSKIRTVVWTSSKKDQQVFVDQFGVAASLKQTMPSDIEIVYPNSRPLPISERFEIPSAGSIEVRSSDVRFIGNYNISEVDMTAIGLATIALEKSMASLNLYLIKGKVSGIKIIWFS